MWDVGFRIDLICTAEPVPRHAQPATIIYYQGWLRPKADVQENYFYDYANSSVAVYISETGKTALKVVPPDA